MRDQTTDIIVVPGTKRDRNNVCKLADEPRDLTRLLRLGFGLEHVRANLPRYRRGRSLEVSRSANETSEGDSADQRLKEASWFRKLLVRSRRNVIHCSLTVEISDQS